MQPLYEAGIIIGEITKHCDIAQSDTSFFFFWEGETRIIFGRVENLSSGLENYVCNKSQPLHDLIAEGIKLNCSEFHTNSYFLPYYLKSKNHKLIIGSGLSTLIFHF